MWKKIVLFIVLCLIATGIAVYNSDTIYLSGKNNLTVYLPDKLIAERKNSILVTVTDKNGVPLGNEYVRIYIESNNRTYKLFTGKTDSQGTVQPSFYVPKINNTCKLLVKTGTEQITKKVYIDDTFKIFVSTDKPIYQPGQTIHIRALAFEGSNPTASSKPVGIEIQDPAGNKIYRKMYNPNKFGIVYLNYTLSDQLPLGYYRIIGTIDNTNAKTVKSILVKKYVLPKFDIDIEGIKSWYTVDEQISGELTCKYFFGKVVKGHVRIETKTYYGVEWKTVDVKTGKLQDGKFSFTIPPVRYAVGIPVNKNNGYLELNVTVTDEARHTEHKSYILTISRVPILISVIADTNVAGLESTYYVISQYPDGSPVSNAFVRINIGSSYYGGTTYHKVTDNRGITSITFRYVDQRYITIEVSKNRLKHTEHFYLRGQSYGLKIVSDKNSYNLGDTAKFTVYYKGESLTSWVYYDVVSKGFVLTSGRLQLQNGKSNFKIPITQDMYQLAEIRVYKIEPDMSVVGDSVIVGISTSKNMTVDITTDKNVYTPQDNITLKFAVKRKGNPVICALGVSIVDLAVYEVSERFIGFEKIHFGLEDQFLTPQYQICNYVFGSGTSYELPTHTVREVNEFTSGEFVTTGPANIETATKLKNHAVKVFWQVLICLGIVGYFGLLILAIKYKVALVLFVIVLLSIPAGVFLYYMTMGFGGTTTGIDDDMMEVMPATPGSKGLGGKRDAGKPSQSVPKPTKIRQYFPETWYWHPTLITDDDGVAVVKLVVPDSITTWSVETVASTQNAEFARTTKNITVFQEFFIEPDIPVSVIRTEIFPLKVLVYNYENFTKNITVKLYKSDWFTLLSNDTMKLTVDGNSVGSIEFVINATEVGEHDVKVHATDGTNTDIVIKNMRVDPNGKPVERIINGQLDNNQSVEHTILLSQYRVAKSENAYIKLQGGMESVILDGAEDFIKFVSGCGEQSTSLLSVDVAAYKNLMKSNATPEQFFKYETIINQGIQHVLIYLIKTSDGKAICWHVGEPPDLWLTAWAILAFKDVRDCGFDLDPKIISDMQTYLISNQKNDGSYEFPDIGHWSINSELLGVKVASTSYITRSLLYSGYPKNDENIKKSVRYIETNVKLDSSAFTLSLALIALTDGDGNISVRKNIADKLVSIRKEDKTNGTVWWSWSLNRGYQNTIETTAYALIALHKHGGYTNIVKKAIKYLLTHRFEGRFGSTHDTAMAFQALNIVGEIRINNVTVDVYVENKTVDSVTFTTANRDLTYLIDLRPYLLNITKIILKSSGDGTVLYQIYYEEYLPWHIVGTKKSELILEVSYDTTNITVNDCIEAHLKLRYVGSKDMLKMVLIDLRAPVGFSFIPDEWDALLKKGVINQYEIRDRQLVVYIDNVVKNKLIEFKYSLKADMPIKGIIQGVCVWDMYNPDNRTELNPINVISHEGVCK